jgi:hypothetical protein
MNKNYIAVLCCSSKKSKERFCYNDQYIKFVASPQMASKTMPKNGVEYYKPDDKIPGENKTWRDLVLEQKHSDLVTAYCLYCRDIYKDFYRNFGDRFYILSAGWGIIRANFKIPTYDITYSTTPKVPEYAKRGDNHGWKDINHLQEDSMKWGCDSEVILFAGSAYVSHFREMAQSLPNSIQKRILVYTNNKSEDRNVKRYQNLVYQYYYSPKSTNWHLEAAETFLSDWKKANQAKG